MKFVLTGGGTAGSVVPLIALIPELRKRFPEAKFVFIGTRRATPESDLLRGYGIEYRAIFAGKLRRYFDLKNIADVVLVCVGFVQSLALLAKIKPAIIIGAGGFVSVPVIWAGKVLGIHSVIHQQDIVASLSNKLTACCASAVTVAFEPSLKNFSRKKTVWTGNPCREQMLRGNPERALARFKLDAARPILLVMGGGTGAESLNFLLHSSLDLLLPHCQIIHLTGHGKINSAIRKNGYSQFEFLNEELADVIAAATLVISRSGLSSITELSLMGKATMLVPLPYSHQELNARYIEKQDACVIFNSRGGNHRQFPEMIIQLLNDSTKRAELSSNMKKIMKPSAVMSIAGVISKILE